MDPELSKDGSSRTLREVLERAWCRMKPVDNLWTTLPKRARLIHILALYLTRSVRCHRLQRAGVPDSSRERMRLVPLLCLILGSLSIQTIPANASSSDHYKLYAHSRIINETQYICLSKIIYKESRWNPMAKNGSHYGLGQMRSTHYRDLDPYRQIDATIKYIKGRYGSMCNAWRFHIKKGHY
jgi:hypothetical protein